MREYWGQMSHKELTFATTVTQNAMRHTLFLHCIYHTAAHARTTLHLRSCAGHKEFMVLPAACSCELLWLVMNCLTAIVITVNCYDWYKNVLIQLLINYINSSPFSKHRSH